MSASPTANTVAEVWKYQMAHQVEEFDIPAGAILLHVHEQGGMPCIWMQVDPDAKKERREFQCVGTGHRFRTRYVYLGTAHCGGLVWHVYEVPA